MMWQVETVYDTELTYVRVILDNDETIKEFLSEREWAKDTIVKIKWRKLHA